MFSLVANGHRFVCFSPIAGEWIRNLALLVAIFWPAPIHGSRCMHRTDRASLRSIRGQLEPTAIVLGLLVPGDRLTLNPKERIEPLVQGLLPLLVFSPCRRSAPIQLTVAIGEFR